MEPISKAIAIQADAATVWSALTDPSKIRLWLSDTGVEVSSEWAIGSPMRFHGDFHGMRLDDKGKILALEPERLFAYQYWSRISKLPDEDQYYTVIRFVIDNADTGVNLNLLQSNLITPEIYGHWNFYWNVVLGRIKRVAESGRAEL